MPWRSPQFRMVYQPVYTRDGEIVAFEALLRWQHPTWGPDQPSGIYSHGRKKRPYRSHRRLGHRRGVPPGDGMECRRTYVPSRCSPTCPGCSWNGPTLVRRLRMHSSEAASRPTAWNSRLPKAGSSQTCGELRANCRSCAIWASASRSTTLAPATPLSTTCRNCLWTPSKSIAHSFNVSTVLLPIFPPSVR